MGEQRQRLNVAPYSKIAIILFLVLHTIAIICHVLSFAVGIVNTPADVLVNPLAEMTRTKTEIVGPCLGNASNTTNCDEPSLQTVFEIGSDTQPRCTSVEIQNGLSCGVDERHEDQAFVIEFSETQHQVFDTINVFRLFTYVDLFSIVFHAYALGMVLVSGHRNVFEGCKGVFTELFKCGSKNGSADLTSELPQPSKAQLANPRNPRAPEYNRRWFDLALTFGILTVAVGISVGITQFFTLLHMFLGVQALALLGFLTDDARYQLLVTDSDAYNRKTLYDYVAKAMSNAQLKSNYNYDVVINRFKRLKPLPVGWTQPVRNIVFQIGLMILIWWGITYTINDAADNLIIHMGTAEGALSADAFKHMASIFQWGTGIIGFWMVLILIGDIVDGDRSKADEPTPGNFILDELDGDACFIIVMFVTKIVVTWLCVSTIQDVYNFAGGKEQRNDDLVNTYLNKEINGDVTRFLMTLLGICAIAVLGLMNWFLTPSSRVYCYVGLKLEQACCNKYLPEKMRKKNDELKIDYSSGKVSKADADSDDEDVGGEPGEEKLDNLYF